tara:strand:- start:331 stop:2649 length:2319 start_codon:yes stop_codon:yes gene_type:complete
MKINFVTSFNEEIYTVVGHHLINSIKNNWEPSIKVTGYYHDFNVKNYIIKDINLKSLNKLEDYTTYLKVNKEHDGTENKTIPYNWHLDSLRWSHKVFALTEKAFELAEESADAGWLIWIDADSLATKRLVPNDILSMLPKECDVVYKGIINHSDGTSYLDTSFIAFNLNKKPALDLLGDLRGAYISGEFLQYREWHDAFILERLLNIYQAHGMKIKTVEQIGDYIKHFEGIDKVTTSPIRDDKGNRLVALSKDKVSQDIMPSRYRQLADVIRHYKPKSIIEVGTWNGGRAIEMALAAFENQDEILYRGFDLFEDATSETDDEEFNLKAHNTQSAVIKRLQEFRAKMMEKKKVFTFEIGKGNSKEILKDRTDLDADFVLIGGGNSIATAKSDYDNLKHNPIVVMDNFFREDEEKLNAPEKYKGTNKVIDSLPKGKEGQVRRWVIPSQDQVRNGGHTHIAVILNGNDVPSIPKNLLSVPIIVHPRDCVPKDFIRDNIKTNMKLINAWLGKFPMHKSNVILVSGGPYLNIPKLKTHIKNNPDSKIVCVKHSYPKLLKNGIIPWACIVLDPRPITGVSTHGVVREELFKKIEKKTKFFVASMTDPSVTKYLISKGAEIHGWHAFTESLRDPIEQNKKMVDNSVTLDPAIGIPPGATLITGGTCAAMRSLGIFHTMGFRSFDLFGFDCSMEEPTKKQQKETTGADDEEPRPKYFKVGVGDTSYWTTGELLAMAQDCERTFANPPMEMNLNFYGKDTLVAALWGNKIKEKTFEETFNG